MIAARTKALMEIEQKERQAVGDATAYRHRLIALTSFRGADDLARLAGTEREIEILQQVAKGRTNKEVAEALFISPSTVQVHLRNVFGKLNVGSRTEAVTFALREGWITLDPR